MRLRAFIKNGIGYTPVWYSFQYGRWLLTPTRDALTTLSADDIADAIENGQNQNLPLISITVIDSAAQVC